MEYLLKAGMSASNIRNHLTAIRSMCIIYDCNAYPFRDSRIPLFIKPVKYTIVQASAMLQFSVTVKALYLTTALITVYPKYCC